MAIAYQRRKRWEAELLAIEIANKIGILLGGEGGGSQAVQGASGKVYQRTTPEGLMGAMGAKWK